MFNISEHGAVTVLEIAHGKANAMDLELCLGLTGELEMFGAASRPLVLTGQGKAFSAGVDLVRLLEGGPEYVRVFLPALVEALEKLFDYPAPVVAAVNGHAVAGGCLLACCADHRVMAQGNGRIGVPELLVGVPFPAIALECMRFAVAPGHFQRLVCGGETLLPNDALAAGLVDEVVEPDRLMEVALEHAGRLAGVSPSLFALTKKQVRRPVAERVREAEGDYEAQVNALWTRPDILENVGAYVTRVLGRGKT